MMQQEVVILKFPNLFEQKNCLINPENLRRSSEQNTYDM